MLRLISFLYASRNILLFLFLEGIALFIVLRFNSPQRHALGDSLLEFSLNLSKRKARVTDYFSLRSTNDQLRQSNESLLEENIRLKRQLKEREKYLQADSSLWIETFQADTAFALIRCEIIQNSTDRSFNYFTLDRGWKEGIEVDMGVITEKGVVGKIIETTENYSMGISLLHQSLKLSIKSLNKENIGVYQWPGKSPRKGFAKIIPSDRTIQKNDTLVTTGFNHIFPENFPVGLVDSVGAQTPEGFYEVWINLATDFYRLKDVFVVNNLNKPILDELAKSVQENNE
ncbi:MAG: rod shape-determining protein MreC [Bacteroidota bacterium]